jgi:anti-sigma factor RsiW
VSDCHELRVPLGAYILGALDPVEAATIREHVATCPSCAAEYARLAPLPGLLTLAAGAEAAVADPPPPALEERLLDAVALEAPARRRRRRVGWRRPRRRWLAVGAATAALAAGVAGVVIMQSDDRPPGYGVTLQASAAAPRASAWAQLRQVASGTSMKLWVKDLPHDAAVYEVHCDAPGWSASAGTFRVGPDGSAQVVLTAAARRGQYDAIRIVRQTDHRVVFTASLI